MNNTTMHNRAIGTLRPVDNPSHSLLKRIVGVAGLLALSLTFAACSSGTSSNAGDTTAPDAAVITTAGTTTNNPTPTISGTAEADSTITLYDTDGTTQLGSVTADTNGDWSITASTLSDGTHSLTVTVTDAAGNTSVASSPVNFTVDATAPTTTSSATGGTYGAPQTVTLSVNETATIYYTTDGTTPTTGSATYSSDISISTDTTLKFFAVDSLGNEESVVTLVFTIDTTAPTTTANIAGGRYNTPQSVSLSTNEPATIYYTTDGTTPTTSSATYSGEISVSDTVLKFFAVDSLGNTETVKTETYVQDTDAPTIDSYSPLANATGVEADSTISVTFSEAMDTSTITTTTFSVDGGVSGSIAFSGGDTIATFTPSANLNFTTLYTATLTSGIKDVAGNALTGSSWSFTTREPSTSLYGTVGENWNDYVKASDTSLACDRTEGGGGYAGCIHAGEKRFTEVSGYSACTGLTATDALGAFDWVCDDSTNPVRMVSTSLKADKNLSDLLDFTTPGWLNNSITVKSGGSDLFTTDPGKWWNNPVEFANSGGSLSTAGTIYLATVDPAAKYTMANDRVALVVKPGVTLSGPGGQDYSIYASRENFIWLEGEVDAIGTSGGIYWYNVGVSVMRNVQVSNAAGWTDSGDSGIRLLSSFDNSLSNITVANNTNHGLSLNGSRRNTLHNISASNNGSTGIYLSSSPSYLVNITASNNAGWGEGISTPYNTPLSNITLSHNTDGGLLASQNNAINNVLTANNGHGIYLYRDANTLSNIVSAHGNYGIHVDHSNSSDNYFTGLLKAGGNTTEDCYATGTNPGIVHGSCANSGRSDATFTTGITLANSFLGKVTSDDTTNTSDTSGIASYASSLDWTSFDNAYRGWGNDGAVFPSADNRGQWTASTGRIWDWRLASGDTGDGGNPVVLNVLSPVLNGDAANTIEHKWSITAANQATCNANITGSVFNATDDCRSTYLRNASEIMGDGMGNENGLCESNETCLFTPNIGSYQGHGSLVSAGSFADGDTITGVTLMKYESNGN